MSTQPLETAIQEIREILPVLGFQDFRMVKVHDSSFHGSVVYAGIEWTIYGGNTGDEVFFGVYQDGMSRWMFMCASRALTAACTGKLRGWKIDWVRLKDGL
jgi:hypothetical protein